MTRKIPAHRTEFGERGTGHVAINKRTGETLRCACPRTVDHWGTMQGTWQDTHPTLF